MCGFSKTQISKVYTAAMRKYAFLILLLAVVLCGCKGNNLIGKWNVSGMEMPVPTLELTAEFTSTDIILYSHIPDVGVTRKIVGTYKVEGDMMTTNFTDWVVDGSGTDVDKANKDLEMMKPMMLQGLNKNPKATIKWIDKDTFTMTNEGNKTQATFTRAK